MHGPHEAVLILPQSHILAGTDDFAGFVRLDLKDHAQPVQANVVITGNGHRIAVETGVLAQRRSAGL
ncbi:hypothetical protein D3C84_1180830 [compost metagenome]